MALTFKGKEATPNYVCISTDIESSTIDGISIVGGTVFSYDDSKWYVIEPDLTLSEYTLPVSFSGTIALGEVSLDQTTPGTTNGVAAGVSAVGADGFGNFVTVLTAPGSVNSAPLANFPYGFNGVSWDKVRIATISKDLSTVALGSITTVWTPATGKKFRLMGGTISSSAAVSILFEDNSAGTTIFRTPKLLVDTPYDFIVNGGQGKLSASANNVLKATSSSAANITGTIWGTEE